MSQPALATEWLRASPVATGSSRQQPSRHPDSWAAYGRFIFASVQKRVSRYVHVAEDGTLHYFRRRDFHLDASLLYAYQDCRTRSDCIWTTATRALRTLLSYERVDHLNVFVTGSIPPEDESGSVLRYVLDGDFVGLAFPYPTRDILEFPDGFECFLGRIGHNKRRHLRARLRDALAAGLRFELNADYESASPGERRALGLRTRPEPYAKEVIKEWDDYALAQPGFFQCSLRCQNGRLLSYSTGFFEGDSAVMMYQLNDSGQPQYGLSMAMRGCLIRHCADAGIKRLLLPMGVAGHLAGAATTNPVSQVLLVRRGLPSVAKALLLRLFARKSHAAHLVATSGFYTRILSRCAA